MIIASDFSRGMLTREAAGSAMVLFRGGIGKGSRSSSEDGTVRTVKAVLGG